MKQQGGLLVISVTLVSLVTIVALPLFFVMLQAVFPELGRGSFAEPFAPLFTSFSDARLPGLLFNTVKLGVGTALGCLVLALPLALLRGLFRLPLAGLWDLLFLIPFMIPPYIGALAWVLLAQQGGFIYQLTGGWHAGGLLFSYAGIVAVMTLHLFPLVYFALSRSLRTAGIYFLQVGRVSGSSPLRALLRITLPLSLPGLAAGLLLVFALTIEEYGTPATLGPQSQYWVVVTAIHQRFADWPVDLPGAAVLSTLLVGLALLAFALHQFLVTRGRFETIAGKYTQSQQLELGRAKWPVMLLFATVALLAVVLPVAGIMASAFTRTLSGGLALDNWGLLHFKAVLSNSTGGLDALRNSVLLAGGAALGAGVLGIAVAYVTVRSSLPGKAAVDALALLPNTLPGMVVAVGLILAWNQPWWPIRIYNTPAILVLAYICLLLPYPVRYASAGLRQIGPSLEAAARVSGAGLGRTLLRILTPLILPHVLVSMLLVFAIASRELVSSIMLAPPGVQTVATFVFNQFEQGESGQGMALSVLGIFSTTAILVVLGTLYRRYSPE